MLYGTVDYTLKDGRGTTVDWSARAHFVKKEGEELKMDFYQVYLVSFSSSSSGKVKADFLFVGYCGHGECQVKESYLTCMTSRNEMN